MPSWKCPTCGYVAEVGHQDQVTVCSYCRTCFTVEGGIIRDHFLVPMYYSSSQALESLLLWIKKQVGADEGLPLHLEVTDAALDYYPFWHVNLFAQTTFSGTGEDATYGAPIGLNTYRAIHRTSKPESGSIDRGFSLTYPASANIPSQLLSYSFPTKSRKYFSEVYAKEHGGRVHNGLLTQAAVEERARVDATDLLAGLVSREIFQVTERKDELRVEGVYYLHVPIWRLQYKYRGKPFLAYVDASTGRVVHATYPVSLEHRASYGVFALAHVGAGLVAAVILGRLNPLLAVGPAIGFFVGAGIFAVRALWRGRAREAAA